MEEIVSIHSIVHKKKKNITKSKNSLSNIQSQSSSKNLKLVKSHSSDKSAMEEKLIKNITNDDNYDLHSNLRKKISQKIRPKLISLYNSFDIENQTKTEPILCEKAPLFSEKDAKSDDEEPYTPVMNLQRRKKPNYLMKSAFIKDKSLTPQEKSFQKTNKKKR